MKFGGNFEMKKLKEIAFIYDDGSSECIQDPRAALVFQSRANSSGILSGLEEYVIRLTEGEDDGTDGAAAK